MEDASEARHHQLRVKPGLQGKWVIILDDHIIVSGTNVKELLDEAKKQFPRGRFVLAKIPEEGTLIY